MANDHCTNVNRFIASRLRDDDDPYPASVTAYRPVLAVLLLPSLLLIGVFSYYPAVRSLIGGFYQWNGFSPPTYAGVSQFKAVPAVADVRHRGEEPGDPGRRQPS